VLVQALVLMLVLLVLLVVVVALVVRRESRSASGWVCKCWAVPETHVPCTIVALGRTIITC
jgi:uncharacterized membrane protein YhaH (DUF805 family)